MRHEKLTKSELADRWGVDVRTITNYMADGMPSRKESGKPVFSWPECRDWRDHKIRTDERALRHSGGSEKMKEKAAELRLRQLEIEVDQADLDLAERRAQLVPVDFMASEFGRIAQGLRKAMQSFPATWAERLGSATTTLDRQIMLEDGINDIMPLLAELADAEEDDGADPADDASDVIGAEAEPDGHAQGEPPTAAAG